MLFISPGHHIADTELRILARFSSNFVANLMLVHRLFVWRGWVIIIGLKSSFLYWLSLTFQFKANDCVRTHFMYCICLYANEGRESKTKDSVYNTHLNFRSFFSGKKVRIITRVNTIYLRTSFLFYKPLKMISDHSMQKLPIQTATGNFSLEYNLDNTPFPSLPKSLLQSESKCKILLW